MIGAAVDRQLVPSPSVQPVLRRAMLASENDRGAATAAVRGRVLIVEDEYFLALENEAALHAAGYKVVGIATTADDAVLIARQNHPDVVLMDIRLAGSRDGIDAAIEISDRLGIAIIFATALSDGETRERAERSFALGWLSKPYSSNEMLDAISRAMQLLRDRQS